MPKSKFYVVWKGLKPGIYDKWEDCAAQIRGFEGALYKSFVDLSIAEKAYREKPHLHMGKSVKTNNQSAEGIIRDSLAVDGAWNTVSGDMEYRGVYVKTGQEIFRKGPYRDGTNNIGEFLAIVHALAYLQQHKSKMPVYSDSQTAITWVRNKRANTKLQRTERNAELFDLISRAETWLLSHSWENRLIKWNTPVWGEIPADFGRK